MPTVVTTEIEAYAHCNDVVCPGMRQEPVAAYRDETGWTCAELGGDLPMTERSSARLRFANEDDVACKHCDGERMLSEIERPKYQRISGQNPDALLRIRQEEGLL